MYSMVLMMALSGGGSAPAWQEPANCYGDHVNRHFRHRRHGCGGCCGGCYGCCGGCYGCNGGCGGCWGGCHGCYGGCCGGCYGSYGSSYGSGYATMPYAGPTYGASTEENVEGRRYYEGAEQSEIRSGEERRDGRGTEDRRDLRQENRENRDGERRDNREQRRGNREEKGTPNPRPGKGTSEPREGAMAPSPATFVVSLPADAKLTVDGNATRATSGTRTFVTPPLDQGQEFRYTLTAYILENGKTVATSRDISVRAGATTRVRMNFDSGVARR